ncbi:MAG: hypothetical protein VCD33_12005 [Alphaproteobacteria bacterium]
MAKKTTKAKKPKDLPGHIMARALDLAALQGWRHTTLGDVVDAADLTLGEVLAIYPSKASIVSAFVRATDAEVLAGGDGDLAEQPPRDRLFDVMMRRFDALGPHKDAVRSMVGASLGDPVSALCGAFLLRRSMALMLEAAHIGASGMVGIIRIKGLAAIYLAVMRVWLKDDSDDAAATMAALDKRLGQAESLLALCRFRGRRNEAPEGEGEAA